MFKNLKLGARISLGFGALILIVAGIATLSWVNLSRIDTESRVITVDCLPGEALAGAIESGAWQYFANVVLHVVADDASDMAKRRKAAEESMAAIKEGLTKYEQTITLDEDRQLFARLKDVLTPFEAHSVKVMSLGDEGKKDESRAELSAAEDEAAQVKVAARAVSDFNARNGARAGSMITGVLSAARLALGVGAAAGVLLGILLAWFITRGITKPVNRIIQALTDGASQVNDASRQVSSASQQLAAGASEQASSLEETSSALEEMAAMTRTNAANSEKANGLASQARHNATAGEKTMGELNNAMTAINDSAAQIGKIIKVIEEIAFQTNLLALNAAVEAARAGEHGKGFAVVAEEVRNLAQRSAQAARDTTNLIEGAVARAKEGTTVASEAAKSLNAIVGDVANVAELLSGISRASNEQAQGVDQINSAVSQMDKVTQQNAAGAEESASAAEELSAQSQTVKAVVDELTALVRGGRAACGSDSSAAQPRQPGRPKKASKPEASPKSALKPAAKFAPKPAASKAASDDEQFAALAETAQSYDNKNDGASGDLSGF